MILTLPETIRIDGVDFDVKYLDESVQVMPDTFGSVDYRAKDIRILAGNDQLTIQSLWHEILHVIDRNRLGNKLTERDIEGLAIGICQVLFDNSDFAVACYTANAPDLEFEPDDADDDEDSDEDSE